MFSPSQTRRRSVISSAKRGRWKTNVWQREGTVGSTLAGSVVRETEEGGGGGAAVSQLDHFERGSRGDRDARLAGAVGGRGGTGRAVERLREDPRHRRLAGSARPGEEVRLTELVALDRVAERADDGLLADDLVEILRAVLPVERGHAS